MADILPLPPTGVPQVDPRTGEITEPWKRYFLSLENAKSTAAPVDAKYWVSTFNSSLTDETNLGALLSGYLKVTVAAGTAVPSTTSGVPGGDITGLVPLSNGGTAADLSATGGASQVVQQTALGGGFSVGQLAYSDIGGLVMSTYAPTLTNVTNVDASTTFLAHYIRVGAGVIVAGKFAVDATAAAATELGVSLPIASNITDTQDVGGTANAIAIQQAAGIIGDVANNRAAVQFLATGTANQTMSFIFFYRIRS